ncbi:MAG: hypothetical protein GEU98_25550 [Pseudonocardiaceae bacterium]|nr:hypothetical protein [Pseudonocardiaceae bacterium]
MHGQREGRYPYGNPVLVNGPDGQVLIDSAIGVVPPEADAFLLSHHHEDHVVGVAASGRPALIHERDHAAVTSWNDFASHCGYTSSEWHAEMRGRFAWQPIESASSFGDGFCLDLGGAVRIRSVPLPGHTPGHCGFWIEPDNVLYLGDIDLSTFGPFYGDVTSCMAATRRSLETVREIDADRYVTFHHKGMVAEPVRFRDALDRHAAMIERRAAIVVDLVAHRPRSADELVGTGVVFRPGTHPSYGHEAERRMCLRHLDELVAIGLVLPPDEKGRYHLRC